MKTPLANRAALAIIDSTCNPGLRHSDAHNVTANLCAEIIARETTADDLLTQLKYALNLLQECTGLEDALKPIEAAIAKTGVA